MQRCAKRAIVHGRVQGVGFRWFVRAAAQAAGVAGWVTNRADGAVEAQLEGASNAVDDVLAALRRGPAAARVERVDVHESADERSSGFDIRRGA